MPLSVALIGAVAIIGLIVFLAVRSNRLFAERDKFFAERSLVERSDCPAELGHPFVYDDLRSRICYDGPLSPQRPLRFTFVLGTRQREGAAGPGYKSVIDQYVGAYLPSASLKLDDAWLTAWQKKVAERGDGWAKQTGLPVSERGHGLMGPPESMPIRAVRTRDGGVFIAWHCMHLRDRFEKRLAELLETLPR